VWKANQATLLSGRFNWLSTHIKLGRRNNHCALFVNCEATASSHWQHTLQLEWPWHWLTDARQQRKQQLSHWEMNGSSAITSRERSAPYLPSLPTTFTMERKWNNCSLHLYLGQKNYNQKSMANQSENSSARACTHACTYALTDRWTGRKHNTSSGQ